MADQGIEKIKKDYELAKKVNDPKLFESLGRQLIPLLLAMLEKPKTKSK